MLGQARADSVSDFGMQALGVTDAVNLLAALSGLGGEAPPPGYLPFAGGMRLGGKYAPRTPGLTAETLHRGDKMVGFEGNLEKALINPGNRAYNLRNEEDEIVASANRQMYPAGREQSGSAYIPSMWVDPRYRKTPAMFDLYNLLSRGGKTPLRATFADRRLEKAFNRRMGDPAGRTNYDSDLDDISLDPEPMPGEIRNYSQPEPSLALVRALADNPRAANRQLTNRDVPSSRQMAPRARPPEPQPKKKPLVHAATAARQAKEARNRRGGR